MPQEQNLSVPIAIVIAGALIAGALFFGGQLSGNTPSTTTQPTKGAVKTFVAVSDEDHVLGNPDAKIAIVEYTDLECPFCKQFHGTMKQIMDTYGTSGEAKWILRDFPLEQLHPNAPKIAEAAECVAELGGNTAYWAFIDSIFEIAPINTFFDITKLASTAAKVGVSQSAFDTCLSSGTYKSEVKKEYDDALAAGGSGTPYIVFALTDKLSAGAKKTVLELEAQFVASGARPGTLVVSDDSKRIGMSGALPFTTVDTIIKAVLGK